MKRFLIYLLTFLCLFVFFACGGDNTPSDETKPDDREFAWEKTDGGITVTKYQRDETEVEVPETIDGQKVVSIGRSAFEGKKIVSVKLPQSVRSIGKYAFRRCVDLTSVEFSEGLETIEIGAFNYCVSLKDLNLPSTLVTIEENAFGVTPIEKLTLPENVRTVGQFAFRSCEYLTEFIANDELVEIGERAFEECVRLSSVYLGKNTARIGKLCFSGCVSLTEIELPPKVSVIEEGLFLQTSLVEYTVPENVTEIKDHAFAYCKFLMEINIHEKVATIGDDIFGGNTRVTVIGVPDSEAEIYADYHGLHFEKAE